MRYTKLEVTVGDLDSKETTDEIQKQVAIAVRGAGFVTVYVTVTDADA